MCSVRKGVLRNFTKFIGKHLKASNFIKKEALAQVFSCEFCEISKNTFFTEHLWATASVYKRKQDSCCSLLDRFALTDLHIVKTLLKGESFPKRYVLKRDVTAPKNVCIRSFCGLYFPEFWLIVEIYRVNLRIQTKCGKIPTRKTPDTHTSRAVCCKHVLNRKIFGSW